MFYNKQQEQVKKNRFEFFKEFLNHFEFELELWLFKREVE